jgi:hypothetical protein
MRVVALLLAMAFSLGWSTGHAENGARLGQEWLGYFSGTVSFNTIFPPRAYLLGRDDEDSLPIAGPPIRVSLAIGDDEGGPSMWLAIAGGPMSTGADGETLQFGRWTDADKADLDKVTGAPPASQFLMVLDNGKLRTEAEFKLADGGAWWRYVTLSPTANGLKIMIWVFDASGARSWSGLVRRED